MKSKENFSIRYHLTYYFRQMILKNNHVSDTRSSVISEKQLKNTMAYSFFILLKILATFHLLLF